LKSKSTLQLISAVSTEAITHWLNSLPAGSESEPRAILFNDGGVAGLELHALPIPVHTQIKWVSGCACCLGALVLRTELIRLLRQAPAHIQVVSTHWAHLASLDQALSGPPFDLYTDRLPSILLLTAAESAPEKKSLLDGLVGNWQSEWVVTN
jgi:G3E family GTPase